MVPSLFRTNSIERRLIPALRPGDFPKPARKNPELPGNFEMEMPIFQSSGARSGFRGICDIAADKRLQNFTLASLEGAACMLTEGVWLLLTLPPDHSLLASWLHSLAQDCAT